MLLRIVILCLVSNIVLGQSFTHDELDVNIGGGFLLAHKKVIRHLPQEKPLFLDFSYTKYSASLPNFGIGANIISSGNANSIGNLCGIYGFTKLRLNQRDSTFKFKIGFGLGYVSKIFDINGNNKNNAIGSHWNSNVVFKLEKLFRLRNGSFFRLGGGLTHFSNGSFQTPNLGLNFFMIHVGYSFLKEKTKAVEAKPLKYDENKKWNYGIALRGGIRENFAPYRGKFPLLTFSLFSTYRQNHKRNIVGGFDCFYNPSVLYFSDNYSPIQLGLFIGKEWVLNQLILGIDMGGYIYDEYRDDGIFYQRLNIHTYVSKKLKLSFLLKSHWTVAQVFQLGIGVDF